MALIKAVELRAPQTGASNKMQRIMFTSDESVLFHWQFLKYSNISILLFFREMEHILLP